MATQSASVPAGAANTVVAVGTHRLSSIVVTTAGTGATPCIFYDNATTNAGTILFEVPGTVAIATTYTNLDELAHNGITVANVASGPVLQVWYD